MPNKTPSSVRLKFSETSINQSIGRRRRTRLAESDEAALLEGNVEEMVRELVRETIENIERYLDE